MEILNGKLNVPEGTEVIEAESFLENGDLEDLYLPDSVRIIGPAAFCQCGNLRKVRMSPNVTEIGDGAFLGTPFLTDMDFPQGLERIGDMAFWESGLLQVRIPDSVKEIGESAFWECESLTRADVLGEETKLGTDCFGSCPSLTEGFIAPGYPEEDYGPSNLLFTLLWASCPEKHNARTCRRAEEFIRQNGELILDSVLKSGNAAALRGLTGRELLNGDLLDLGVRRSAQTGQTELGAMFLAARSAWNEKQRGEKAEDIFADLEL